MECPRCHELASPAALACRACAAPLRFGEEPPPARLDRTLDLDRRLGRREEVGEVLVTRDLDRDLDRDADSEHDRYRYRDVEGGCDGEVELGCGGDGDLDLDPDVEVAPVRLAAAAVLLDGAFIAVATILPALAAAWLLPAGVDLTRALLPAALALCALVIAAYGVLGQVLLGASPGERLLGIAVIDASGRTPGMGRAALRLPLALIGTLGLGAGLWPALFTESRRTLHDRVAGTRVVRAP